MKELKENFTMFGVYLLTCIISFMVFYGVFNFLGAIQQTQEISEFVVAFVAALAAGTFVILLVICCLEATFQMKVKISLFWGIAVSFILALVFIGVSHEVTQITRI